MSEKALSQYRVIDLTHYTAGPYCTKLMAGFGADVIKIEHPKTGDGMRRSGPFFKDKEGIERSIPFLWLNTGKKSITLNLKTNAGKEILKRLVKEADAVIENFSPGVMSRLGFGYETLKEINPRIVMTSISNFGQSGPYRDYKADEIGLNALSGGMHMTGDPEAAPLKAGPSFYQYTAGQHAYIATLMALLQRGPDGEGQYIDLSIQESGLEHLEITLSYFLREKKNSRRGAHMFVPWGTYECRDGYATVIAMPARHWHRAQEIFKDEGLFEKKYEHIIGRMKERAEYEERTRRSVRGFNKKELFEAGQSRGLTFGYVCGLEEVMELPQHVDRKFFRRIDHPETGSHRYMDAPFRMSRTPWESSRAPLLGEHNELIYGGLLGYSPDEMSMLRKEEMI